MTEVTYRVIKSATRGIYKEKGSKFIACACRVEGIGEVKPVLEQLGKQYHDARHLCFAHIIKVGDQYLVRANDDGEPGHTAGTPILGQIRSFDLVNTLVVVARYFGGTKLGVPGLIHAYKSAAEDALSKAVILTVEVKTDITVNYPYFQTREVMRLVNEFGVEIKDQQFTDRCSIKGRIQPKRFETFRGKMLLLGLSVEKEPASGS